MTEAGAAGGGAADAGTGTAAAPATGTGGIGAGSAALLAITMFFWGTAFQATDVGARHASPVVFSALRATPATLALLAVMALTRRRLPRDRRTLCLGAVTGVLTVSLTLEGIAEGTKLAGPGNAAVLINTVPFFTVLFARLLYRARTPAAAVGGLITGFTGIVVMVQSQLGGGSVGRTALGMALALVAAAGFAAAALVTARAARRDPQLDMLGLTTVQYIVGSLGLIVLMAIYGHPGRADWGSSALYESAAWVALGSSAVASVCFNQALRRVAAARATAWQFLVPVVAVIVAAVRGDVPGVVVLVGMALAIVGVAVVSAAQFTVVPDGQ